MYSGPGVILYFFRSTGNYARIQSYSRLSTEPGISNIVSFDFISFIDIELRLTKTYIDIFSEVMLVLGFGVESVSSCTSESPSRISFVVIFIRDMISWAFGSLLSWVREIFTIAVYFSHLLGLELLGLGFSGRSSKGIFRCAGFFRFLDISEGGVNFSVGEFD